MRFVGRLLLIPGTLVALGILALQLYPPSHTWHPFLIAAATFIPLLWVPVVVALVGLILLSDGVRRVLGIIALVIAIASWGWDVLQDVVSPERMAQVEMTPQISVFMLNAQYGRADVDQVGALVDEHRPDLLVLLEYTPAFDTRLAEGGVVAEYPYRVGTVREDAGGTMLLSRTPLTEVERLETSFDNIVVRTTVGELEWTVAGIHTVPPQMGAELWTADGEAVRALAERHDDERFLMIGDFNAIEQHHTMRLLDDTAMVNTMATNSGLEGWRPTWPVGRGVPAFARIDHSLHSRDVHGWARAPIVVDGTDHKGLLSFASELR